MTITKIKPGIDRIFIEMKAFCTMRNHELDNYYIVTEELTLAQLKTALKDMGYIVLPCKSYTALVDAAGTNPEPEYHQLRPDEI